MSESGIKMWISPSGGTATVDCAMHPKELLIKCGYKPVIVFQPEELEGHNSFLIQEGFHEGFKAAEEHYLKGPPAMLKHMQIQTPIQTDQEDNNDL